MTLLLYLPFHCQQVKRPRKKRGGASKQMDRDTFSGPRGNQRPGRNPNAKRASLPNNLRAAQPVLPYKRRRLRLKCYLITSRKTKVEERKLEISQNITTAELETLLSKYHPLKSQSELERALENIGLSVPKEEARQVINELYRRNRRDETIIKAEFIDKVASKQSSNNIIAFEVPVGRSRADICRLGRFSTVFEIKTEYDSFARLQSQLEDYLEVFDYCYIIVPENRQAKARSIIPEACGIISYNPKRREISFHIRRRALFNRTKDPLKQLCSLSKKELADSFPSFELDCPKEQVVTSIASGQRESVINCAFRTALKKRFVERWGFLRQHQKEILPMDYEWFYFNSIEPSTSY